MNELDSLKLALDAERHNHRSDNEYLLARAKRAEACLAELVALKDGPRDDDYARRKPLAWQAARELLASTSVAPGEAR